MLWLYPANQLGLGVEPLAREGTRRSRLIVAGPFARLARYLGTNIGATYICTFDKLFCYKIKGTLFSAIGNRCRLCHGWVLKFCHIGLPSSSVKKVWMSSFRRSSCCEWSFKLRGRKILYANQRPSVLERNLELNSILVLWTLRDCRTLETVLLEQQRSLFVGLCRFGNEIRTGVVFHPFPLSVMLLH